MNLNALTLLLLSSALALAQSPVEPVNSGTLARGLVGWWSMDDKDATQVTNLLDRSISANLASQWSMDSTNYITGRVAKGTAFDGINDAVVLATASNLSFERSNPFSISAWYYSTRAKSGVWADNIFSKLDSSAPFRGYEFAVDYNDKVANKLVVYLYLVNTFGTNQVQAFTTNDLPSSTWTHVVCTYDGSSSTNGVLFYVNGVLSGRGNGGATSSTLSATMTNAILPNIGARNKTGGQFFQGYLDEVRVYNRVLNQNEVSQLFANPGACSGVVGSFQIEAPSRFQVIQRSAGLASIPISGYVPTTHSIEASFNGGAFATIATSVNGQFSGTLANQSEGYGPLTVRFVDDTNTFATVNPVGIGDVFVIGGQSNAMGYASNNQVYATSGAFGALFGFDYNWKNLVDPTHSSVGQIDAVNNNNGSPMGSVWPVIATHYLTNSPTIPVAFVPCALTGTSITQWEPSGGATNRAALYGDMVWRGKYAAGGCKAVLWWQGENDVSDGMSRATYFLNLTNLTHNLAVDAGVKLIPCKLQHCTGLSTAGQSNINAAIGDAWSLDTNTLAGPDLTGLTTDDGYHLRSDSSIASAASLWWDAIKSALSL